MRGQILMMLGIGATLAATPVRAQLYDPSYPVCIKSYNQGAGTTDCSFTSLEQCNASASGRAGQCSINPYFVPGNRKTPRRSYR